MNEMVCDFRSDTVTRPDAAMRAAMAAAPVGDDVYGEDPTVAALERTVAALTGKAAGLYVPSGTQSNLLALMSHCGRGDEYIAGQDAHCYRYEAGGAAVLGSIQPQPLAHAPDGSIPLEHIAGAIKTDDMHFARTRLLALENTIGGRVLDQDYVDAAVGLARAHGLTTHLDGARLFNAAVASGRPASTLAAPFDTVSVCLSKGLGAPLGSVLTGSEAVIATARRLRKMVGGGMRQAGIVAAGGLHALEHNVARLAEDHARAAALARGLEDIEGISVDGPHTNMVFMTLAPDSTDAFLSHLAGRGVRVAGRYGRLRWVTHKDVGDEAVTLGIDAARSFFDGRTRG